MAEIEAWDEEADVVVLGFGSAGCAAAIAARDAGASVVVLEKMPEGQEGGNTLYDVCTVTFIRLKQRRSPLVGDQQHFSHRLVQRGLSQRGAVVVIWSATAVVGIGGIVLGRLEAWQAILVGVQTALVLIMIALLEYASRHASARDSVP